MRRLSPALLLFVCFFVSCNKVDDPIQKQDPLSVFFKDLIPQADSDTSKSFILIGDWGKQNDSLVAVSEQMAAVADYLDVNFIFTGGDNFYPSGVSSIDDPLWSVYTDNFNFPSLQIPWYVSLGNHDHNGNVQAQIAYTSIDERWYLPSSFYAKTFEINQNGDDLSLLVIDSQLLKNHPDSLNQLNWVDSTAQALTSSWKIMLAHHPLYSYGYHGDSPTMQLLLEDILHENQIDAYFSGHEHDMQHLKTEKFTHFFISGSAAKIRPVDDGPFSLYSSSQYGFLFCRISAKKAEFYFINKEGRVVYQYELIKN